MSKKELMLQDVISQIKAEILTDRTDIYLILEDPSIVDHDSKKGVSYTIHEKLHHLAVHEKALEIAEEMYEAFSNN